MLQGTNCASGTITNKITRRTFQSGLIIETGGSDDHVIKIFCPLIITDKKLKRGLDIIEEALDTVCGRNDEYPASTSNCDTKSCEIDLITLFVCNGRCNGGGMRWRRHAMGAQCRVEQRPVRAHFTFREKETALSHEQFKDLQRPNLRSSRSHRNTSPRSDGQISSRPETRRRWRNSFAYKRGDQRRLHSIQRMRAEISVGNVPNPKTKTNEPHTKAQARVQN
jgi:hypothetical protein